MIDSVQHLSFKQNVAWNSIGNLVYLGSQWLLSYVTTMVLGFEQAGVFSLAMAISGSLANIALYAMRNYQTSDVDGGFSDAVYIVSRYITSILAILACLCFLGVNGYEPITALCVFAYMCFKAVEALSDVYHGIMQRAMRMDYIGKSFIAKGILGFATYVMVMVLTRQLLASIVSLVIVTAGVVVLYDRNRALLLSDSARKEVSRSSVIRLLKACLPLAIFGLLFNTMGQAPRYYLEMVLGTEQLGFYSSVAMPVTIIQVSASFLFSPLTTPFAEKLSSGDHAGFLHMMAKVLMMVGILSVVFVPFFYFLGPALLILLFGARITPYCNLIVPLVLCGILLALSWFLSTLVTVLRHLKSLLLCGAVSFVVVGFGGIPMIGAFGMNGASFVLICSLIVFNGGCAAIIARHFVSNVRLISKSPADVRSNK